MSRLSRSRRLGLGTLLAVVLGAGPVLLPSAPAGAAPAPTPAPPSAISLLPGVLPPVRLPTLGPPATVPVVGTVVSGVNGLGSAVVSTVNGVLAPTSRPAPPRPTPASSATRSGAAPTAPHRATRRVAVPAQAPPATRRPSATQPRPTRSHELAGAPGAGGTAIRTGLLTPSSGISHDPVTLVRQAADAVIHPGRALLTLVAITAVCALGMLGLITSFGRRTRSSD